MTDFSQGIQSKHLPADQITQRRRMSPASCVLPQALRANTIKWQMELGKRIPNICWWLTANIRGAAKLKQKKIKVDKLNCESNMLHLLHLYIYSTCNILHAIHVIYCNWTGHLKYSRVHQAIRHIHFIAIKKSFADEWSRSPHLHQYANMIKQIKRFSNHKWSHTTVYMFI